MLCGNVSILTFKSIKEEDFSVKWVDLVISRLRLYSCVNSVYSFLLFWDMSKDKSNGYISIANSLRASK